MTTAQRAAAQIGIDPYADEFRGSGYPEKARAKANERAAKMRAEGKRPVRLCCEIVSTVSQANDRW